MFGDKLKKARISAKLKQSELAKILNTTNTTISNWENNVSKPDLDTIEYICGALSVPASYFFNSPDSVVKVFTPAEQEHIKKYRGLDDHGKDIVDTVLDKEYNRQQAEKQSKEQESIAIEIPVAARSKDGLPKTITIRRDLNIDELEEESEF